MQDSLPVPKAGPVHLDPVNAELCGWLRAKGESRLQGIAVLARIATRSSLAAVNLTTAGRPPSMAESHADGLTGCCHLCPGPPFAVSQPLAVADALGDSRFRRLTCVAGPLRARSGTVTPILGPDAISTGTLCVMDTRVGREPTRDEITALLVLARLASTLPSAQPTMALMPTASRG
jgi:GAF domain-containing protein